MGRERILILRGVKDLRRTLSRGWLDKRLVHLGIQHFVAA